MSAEQAKHCYAYARPALTVDCVVFGMDDERLKVLLIERAIEPFAECWALPGGFVKTTETLDDAAKRELREETGLSRVFLEQLYTFGQLDRDPRERVVSVGYYALVRMFSHRLKAATDARNAGWFEIDQLPRLAFDHRRILNVALDRLRAKVRYQPIGFELLPTRFTLRQLQALYEVVLDRELDKRNFRKKILSMDILLETDEREKDVAHRAARLYRFNRKQYDARVQDGFLFEV